MINRNLFEASPAGQVFQDTWPETWPAQRIYLASPYSTDEFFLRVRRVHFARQATAALMLAGHVVFSPISHSHELSEFVGENKGHDFWMEQDLPFLRACSLVVVLKLEGYSKSRGVNAEIEEALRVNIPVASLTMPEVWELLARLKK